MHGYDAAAVILSGVEKGFTTPDSLCEYLNELEAYDGLSGSFSFDSNGDIITGVVVKRYDEKCKIQIVKMVKVAK